MLFNSYIFIFIFLPVAAILYFQLKKRASGNAALWFLFAASCVFCSWYSVYYGLFMLCEILANYFASKAIRKNRPYSKPVFISTVALDILVLFLYKYLDLLTAGINSAINTDIPALNLILPLGISFYTFSNVMYLVDSYRFSRSGDTGYDGFIPDLSFIEFATYVSYFPKLVQGPITRHNDLIRQLRDEKKSAVDYTNLCTGLFRFSMGLFKKVMVADKFALLADYGYSHAAGLNGADAIITVLSYSLQIYFDFSGYCDMAIGVSKMLNIDLPENFDSPYKSVSISDFWNRWHITLTSFFTKYLYIPLGGSRAGMLRTLLNVMIVFLISGLWHGDNTTFILWGALHGILMVMERVFRTIRGNTKESSDNSAVNLLRKIFTFAEVSILWSLFRAESLGQFTTLWSRIINRYNFTTGPSTGMTDTVSNLIEMNFLMKIIPASLISQGLWVIILLLTAILVCFLADNSSKVTEKFKPDILHVIIMVVLLIWSVMSLSGVTQFIYSNF
ncbi:MAG: MBOAT family protein [Lachnospiraceae bacterium]|nr:MBOAT family protein [Lachnospiraceae bacterium]